jgi:hypothetical protein
MIKPDKTFAFIFLAFVFFLSTANENYGFPINLKILIHENKNTNPCPSIKKPNPFLFDTQGEKYETSLKNIPVFNLKKNSNNIKGNSLVPEIQKKFTNSEYLTYSVTIYRNLKNSDIVFPFHCFW